MNRNFIVIGLLGLLLPRYAIWFVLVPVIVTAVYLIVYSYVEYEKEKKAGLGTV